MPTTEDKAKPQAAPEKLTHRFIRLWHSLGTKLIIVLLSALVLIFALLGYGAIRLHRIHLENNTLASAERVSDILKRSASYSMMRNDREGLRQVISAVGKEAGVVRVRVIDKEGRIAYSSQS